MRKKTPRFLRSLSVILSASVLAGSFMPAVQTVSAQSTDIDFISSDEEVTSSDTDISLEDIDENTELLLKQRLTQTSRIFHRIPLALPLKTNPLLPLRQKMRIRSHPEIPTKQPKTWITFSAVL